MVLLTITPTIAAALEQCKEISAEKYSGLSQAGEPSLDSHELGKPIAHSQILELWKFLRDHKQSTKPDGTVKDQYARLDYLLRGSNIYVPPPKPKPEPVGK